MPVAELATPVVERIAQNVFSRLEKLRAGYAATTKVSSIVRPTRVGNFTPEDRQIVLTMGDAEPVPELSCPGNPPSLAWRQPFFIRCHVRPSERDDRSVDEFANLIASDVRRVICNATDWHQWDGLAINSSFGPDVNIVSEGGAVEGIAVVLFVLYRVSETDPYTVRA